MARETVAQRNARLAAEKLARQEAERLAYPEALMAALERVTNNSHRFGLTVKAPHFMVTDLENRYGNTYELAHTWTQNSQDNLQELTWELDQFDREQAEAQRRAEVYRAAKQKAAELFSDEERELLGL